MASKFLDRKHHTSEIGKKATQPQCHILTIVHRSTPYDRPVHSERNPFLLLIVALPDASEATLAGRLHSPSEENTENRHVDGVEEPVGELAPGSLTPFQPPVGAMVSSTYQASGRHKPNRILVDENTEDFLLVCCSSLL